MTRGFLTVVLVLVAALPADAQFGRRGRGRPSTMNVAEFNTDYGAQFTFVRIQYTPTFQRGWEPPWFHDYPRAERNFAKILQEVTLIDPYLGGSNVLRMDDPELGKYPVAYLSEPGYWSMSPSEIQGARDYLSKGGFLIVDDFGNWEWQNFEEQMRLLFPEARPVRLDPSHPIFNSFFSIRSLDYAPSYRGYAEFWGYFEDNDPDKRLMVIVNYNADIGDYWEFSDTGFVPIELSNEAYKLGVNYVIYAMMH